MSRLSIIRVGEIACTGAVHRAWACVRSMGMRLGRGSGSDLGGDCVATQV